LQKVKVSEAELVCHDHTTLGFCNGFYANLRL